MEQQCSNSNPHSRHTWSGSDGKKIVVFTCPGVAAGPPPWERKPKKK